MHIDTKMYLCRLIVILGLFRHFFLEWKLEIACPASQKWVKSFFSTEMVRFGGKALLLIAGE